jgi:lysophospholipase L1-like esterase
MPFAAWPGTVSGGGFDDGAGGQVVLVTSPEVRQGVLAAGGGKESGGSILWIDDVLVSRALHVVQPAAECDRVLAELGKDGGVGEVERRLLSSDEALCGDGDGALGRLLETVRSGSGATGCAVVVSVGLQDLLRGVGPGVYERQLSVMCDRLRATGARRLVLVTPPPYPHLEEGLKAFAVAVRRVAAAHGVPVADVFTGVMGARGGTPVFSADHNLAMTSYGHRLVAQVVARTLAEDGVSVAGAREGQVLW